MLVVDDHDLVRDGLTALIGTAPDLTVVGGATDGYEALALARRVRPDVVLMDVAMPGPDGLATTARLLAELPSTRVLVLSATHDPAVRGQAIAAGAHAFLPKHTAPDVLLGAIRTAAVRPTEGPR